MGEPCAKSRLEYNRLGAIALDYGARSGAHAAEMWVIGSYGRRIRSAFEAVSISRWLCPDRGLDGRPLDDCGREVTGPAEALRQESGMRRTGGQHYVLDIVAALDDAWAARRKMGEGRTAAERAASVKSVNRNMVRLLEGTLPESGAWAPVAGAGAVRTAPVGGRIAELKIGRGEKLAPFSGRPEGDARQRPGRARRVGDLDRPGGDAPCRGRTRG